MGGFPRVTLNNNGAATWISLLRELDFQVQCTQTPQALWIMIQRNGLSITVIQDTNPETGFVELYFRAHRNELAESVVKCLVEAELCTEPKGFEWM